jgi:hypothetical protein
MVHRSCSTHSPAARLVPSAPARPDLASEIPPLILIERQVEDQFRPPMLKALQGKIDALAESLQGVVPNCPWSASVAVFR